MVFTRNFMYEKSWEWNEDKYVAFLDLEKACNRVPRQKIWDALREPYYGVPEKLIRAIYNSYQNIRSRVKTCYENEDWFEIQSVVRQGSVLSPLLFILFMDQCMREQHLDQNEIADLMYADDHAMVAQTAEELQYKLSNWNTILTENGMRISKEKTGNAPFSNTSRH